MPRYFAYKALDECLYKKEKGDMISKSTISHLKKTMNEFIDNRVKKQLDNAKERDENFKKIRVKDGYREHYRKF